MTDTDRRRATAMNMAVRQRNYRRARDRALTRLAQAYPDDYKELLEQEKASDEAQGRKWIDIDGTTNQLDTQSFATFGSGESTWYNGENQGNNGGEA